MSLFLSMCHNKTNELYFPLENDYDSCSSCIQEREVEVEVEVECYKDESLKPGPHVSVINTMLNWEIFLCIFDYIDPRLFIALAQVCSLWRTIIMEQINKSNELKLAYGRLQLACWAAENGNIRFLSSKYLKPIPVSQSALWVKLLFPKRLVSCWDHVKFITYSSLLGTSSKKFRQTSQRVSTGAYNYRPDLRILTAAARGGQIGTMIWLYRNCNHNASVTETISVCRYGTVEAVDWILKTARYYNDDDNWKQIQQQIIIWGRSDVIMHIAKIGRKIIDLPTCYKRGLLMADVDFVKWCISTSSSFHSLSSEEDERRKSLLLRHIRPLSPHDIYTDTHFLLSGGQICSTELKDDDDDKKQTTRVTWRSIVIAARWNRLDLMNKLWQTPEIRNTPTPINLATEIVKTNNVDALRWLAHVVKWPFSEMESLQAASCDNFDTFVWLIEHGCPWNETQCSWIASKHGFTRILEWIKKNGKLGEKAGYVEPKPSHFRSTRIYLTDDDDVDDDEQIHFEDKLKSLE